MKLPPEARAEFDALVTAPLQPTSTHKKAVQAALSNAAADQRDALAGAMALLNTIERKTSPLYVRLIHAFAVYACAPERDPALAREVHDHVAHATKNFQLIRP